MIERSIINILENAKQNPAGIRFTDLYKICEYFFGKGRQRGTSHCIYKMPWPGDPRVNIQEGKNGKAKSYQVKQALIAIEKITGINYGKP